MTAAGAFDRWLLAPAPAARLGLLRLLVGVFAVGRLAARLAQFLGLADGSAARFDPVGPLAWLPGPLPSGVVTGLVWVTLALGVAFAAGLWFRALGPAFAVALLALTTFHSSFGQVLYFDNLLVLHVLVLAASPAAAAWSLDARRRAGAPPPAARFGAPVRLAAALTALTYVLAGVAKLRLGGAEWLTGETLRNHVAYSAARLDVLGGDPAPLARLLVRFPALLTPFAAGAVLLELAAPAALLGGRIRTAWALAAWAMHAGIAAAMFVVFPYPLAFVAFAPFYRLERAPARLRSGLRSRHAHLHHR